jgi:hypothetical protein
VSWCVTPGSYACMGATVTSDSPRSHLDAGVWGY